MINNKDKYIEIVNNRFEGKAKDILLRQLDLFYDNQLRKI